MKEWLFGRYRWYYSLYKDTLVVNRIRKRWNKSRKQVRWIFFKQVWKESFFFWFYGKAKYYQRLPTIGLSCFSQKGEELLIRSFFQDKQRGFFLDVGAAWPIKASNTFLLERKLGWSGIAVDANPDYVKKWRRHRKRAKIFTYIVSNQSNQLEKFYKADGVGSIQKERSVLNKIVKGKEVLIPTITLNQLLEENGVEKIDLLSMDIEESEIQALEGFDIKRYQPALVCIERAKSTKNGILAYFEANNYEQVEGFKKYKRNFFFKPKH